MTYKLLAVCLLTSALTSGSAIAETTPDNILGTWRTAVGEQPAPDGSTAYIQVTNIFTANAQDLIFAIFADPKLEIPLFRYHSSGPWEVVGSSDTVPGALEIDMTNDFSRVEIFVDAPDIWAALNMADCPLEIGKAVEISDCVSGPPFIVTDCTDMDLAMVDQDGQRFRFGMDGVDRCETRPTAMGEIAYFKVD